LIEFSQSFSSGSIKSEIQYVVLVVSPNIHEDIFLHGVHNLDHREYDGDNAKDYPCGSDNDYVLGCKLVCDDGDEVSHSLDDWDTSYEP
jgi:hypothetical protein